MNNKNNPMLFSILLSRYSLEGHPKIEDLKYIMDDEVNDCQIDLYLEVIKWINDGKSYEEIDKMIDNIDLKSYQKLSEDKKKFINTDIKKILTLRKNEEKKGMIKDE